MIKLKLYDAHGALVHKAYAPTLKQVHKATAFNHQWTQAVATDLQGRTKLHIRKGRKPMKVAV